MRVLVIGSAGLVGRQVVAEPAEHEVVPFDIVDGGDVLDLVALGQAMAGCDAVIHAAALLGGEGESPEQINAVNVQGTWNVLFAAQATGVRRIVFVSSADVLGVFKGERPPDYLPLDDAHPCRADTPYGLSKRLAEEACRMIAASSEISVVCLRPPGVWAEETYDRIRSARAERPSFEWDPFWEYGAFIDVRDLAGACIAGLTCELDDFAAVLVAAPDITTSGRTSPELARDLLPDVEWRGGARYDEDPFLSLVDTRPASQLLGWRPVHAWNRVRTD